MHNFHSNLPPELLAFIKLVYIRSTGYFSQGSSSFYGRIHMKYFCCCVIAQLRYTQLQANGTINGDDGNGFFHLINAHSTIFRTRNSINMYIQICVNACVCVVTAFLQRIVLVTKHSDTVETKSNTHFFASKTHSLRNSLTIALYFGLFPTKLQVFRSNFAENWTKTNTRTPKRK